jgi:hypothetical protein
MTSFIHTISLNKEQEDFLLEYPELSCSKILQQGVNALMMSCNKGDLQALIQHERLKCEGMMKTIQKFTEFLNKNGLMEEFYNGK